MPCVSSSTAGPGSSSLNETFLTRRGGPGGAGELAREGGAGAGGARGDLPIGHILRHQRGQRLPSASRRIHSAGRPLAATTPFCVALA